MNAVGGGGGVAGAATAIIIRPFDRPDSATN